LIAYAKYIDAKAGKTVGDGIGTQLHLNINGSDTTAIENMFKKLAASGKLIKVSELDVALSSSTPASQISPTVDQLTQQAKRYEFVARKFTQIIPPAQQYGITIWGISDNPAEHVYWIPNDAPNLWDANYVRKPAYKGFCDGLAGKDVSTDFSGELQY
jgi:GH35 family endo-1,4-beta-xylanase